MESKAKNLIKVLLFVAVFGLMSFRDTGIFVKNFNTVKDGVEVNFIDGEVIDVVRSQGDKHIVKKNGGFVEVPFDSLIVYMKAGQKYQAKESARVLQEPNGQIVGIVKEGDLLQILQESGDYGLFEYGDANKGFIYLDDVKQVEVANITKALSLTNEELDNGNTKLKLAEFGEVSIKNYLGGKYILIDADGNEFAISSSKIRLANEAALKEAANRSGGHSGSSRDKLVAFAKTQLGKPYRYGSPGPNSFDCSGFTSYVYKNALGVGISRSSRTQAGNGKYVSANELLPGDLVFFNTSGKGISHVGIYIGNGQMIHASSGANMRVIVSDIFSGYYKSKYVTARRILND